MKKHDRKPGAVVWVVQEGKNDYFKAEDFGTVQFITTGDYRPIADCAQNKEVIADIRRFMGMYIAGMDYIVPVGNPIVVALTIMAMTDKGTTLSSHKLLKWDGRLGQYIPFELQQSFFK